MSRNIVLLYSSNIFTLQDESLGCLRWLWDFFLGRPASPFSRRTSAMSSCWALQTQWDGPSPPISLWCVGKKSLPLLTSFCSSCLHHLCSQLEPHPGPQPGLTCAATRLWGQAALVPLAWPPAPPMRTGDKGLHPMPSRTWGLEGVTQRRQDRHSLLSAVVSDPRPQLWAVMAILATVPR